MCYITFGAKSDEAPEDFAGELGTDIWLKQRPDLLAYKQALEDDIRREMRDLEEDDEDST
jgi:hypothetical protein